MRTAAVGVPVTPRALYVRKTLGVAMFVLSFVMFAVAALGFLQLVDIYTAPEDPAFPLAVSSGLWVVAAGALHELTFLFALWLLGALVPRRGLIRRERP